MKDIEDETNNLKIRKTKYRCQGCSASEKKEIPLCLECFRDYHNKKDKLKARNINKKAVIANKKR